MAADSTLFDTQRYPTVEQTIVNNTSVLYKRKKFFLQDLRQLMKGLGFVLVALIYLQDNSLFAFITRAFVQYSLHNPFPTPQARLLSDETKQVIAKFLLVELMVVNLVVIVLHLVFGVWVAEAPDHFTHGGLTVQFIGEQLVSTRFTVVVLDLLLFFEQLVFYSLMCATDDSKVLATTREMGEGDDSFMDRFEIEGDGYTGTVHLMEIDVLGDVWEVLRLLTKLQFPQNRPV